jgi:hypothetical protein
MLANLHAPLFDSIAVRILCFQLPQDSGGALTRGEQLELATAVMEEGTKALAL